MDRTDDDLRIITIVAKASTLLQDADGPVVFRFVAGELTRVLPDSRSARELLSLMERTGYVRREMTGRSTVLGTALLQVAQNVEAKGWGVERVLAPTVMEPHAHKADAPTDLVVTLTRPANFPPPPRYRLD